MTDRKPPGISFETWADRQIREAQEGGAFEGLAGKGKPLPSTGAPSDELWWVKDKMRREGLSFLPPSLVLRKEAEDALAAARAARTEVQARRVLEAVNERIREAIRRPPEGPPLNLAPFDVEQVIAEWRESRAAAEPSRVTDGADATAAGAGSPAGADRARRGLVGVARAMRRRTAPGRRRGPAA